MSLTPTSTRGLYELCPAQAREITALTRHTWRTGSDRDVLLLYFPLVTEVYLIPWLDWTLISGP